MVNVYKSNMRHDLSRICQLIVLLVSLSSCKTTKVVVLEKDPVQVSIEKHIDSKDVDALINDCKLHPEYANIIRNHFLYDNSLDEKKYNQLISDRNLWVKDSIMYNSLEANVRQYENDVLTSLQSENLNTIVYYYKSNSPERVFLDDIMRKGIVGKADGLNYVQTRAVYKTLKDTKFEDDLYKVYNKKRKAQAKFVKQALVQQRNYEKKALEELKVCLSDTLESYLSQAFGKIILELAKTDLPSKHSEIDKRFYQIQSKYVDFNQINRIAESYLRHYTSSVNKSRSSFYKQITGESYVPKSLLLDDPNYNIPSSMTKDFSMYPIYSIADMEEESDGIGAVLGVAGLFLSGPLGWLATGVSAVNSYTKAKEKATKKAEYVKSFSNGYLPALMSTKSKVMAEVNKFQKNSISSKKFETVIYENY